MKYGYIDSLHDIYHSMKFTQEFTEGMTFSDFQSDQKTIFAVVRCVEIIGEAVKRLPDTFRDSYPDIS